MDDNKPKRQRWEIALVGGSIIVSVAFSVVLVIIAARRPLTPLEATLFQILVLVSGLGGGIFGSYKLGQSSVAVAARALLRPHARSAIRSLMTLHTSLYRLSLTIEDMKRTQADPRLDLIQAVVEEQIPLGISAVEDWKDVAREEVEDVIRRWPPDLRYQEGEHSDNADTR